MTDRYEALYEQLRQVLAMLDTATDPYLIAGLRKLEASIRKDLGF